MKKTFCQKVEYSLFATSASPTSLECLKDEILVLSLVHEKVHEVTGKIAEANQKVSKWKVRVKATTKTTT